VQYIFECFYTINQAFFIQLFNPGIYCLNDILIHRADSVKIYTQRYIRWSWWR